MVFMNNMYKKISFCFFLSHFLLALCCLCVISGGINLFSFFIFIMVMASKIYCGVLKFKCTSLSFFFYLSRSVCPLPKMVMVQLPFRATLQSTTLRGVMVLATIDGYVFHFDNSIACICKLRFFCNTYLTALLQKQILFNFILGNMGSYETLKARFD